MDIQFPASYATFDWIKKLKGRDEVDAIIPYSLQLPETLGKPLAGSVTPDTNQLVHTTLLFSEGYFYFNYYNPEHQAWEQFDKIQLNNAIETDYNSIDVQDVSVFGEDGIKINQAVKELGRELSQVYELPVFMYDPESARKMTGVENHPDDCTHIPAGVVSVDIIGRSDIDIDVCPRCRHPLGVEIDGTSYARSEVLTELIPESEIKQIDSGSQYRFIEAEIGQNNIVDSVVAFITQEIDAELAISATPEVGEHAMFLEINGTIIGYAEWGQLRNKANLQQLYIIPQARREGYGKNMLQKWINTYVSSDIFYAEEPNEAAKSLHESLNLLSDEGNVSVKHYRTYIPFFVEPNTNSPVFKTIKNSLKQD